MHRETGINHTNDTMSPDLAVSNLGFNHLRDDCAKATANGDSPAVALRQRRTSRRFFSDALKYRQESRLVGQQLATIFERVLPCHDCQFVNEGLGKESL